MLVNVVSQMLAFPVIVPLGEWCKTKLILNLGSGNDLVPPGNKPLPEPMMASLGHNELIKYSSQVISSRGIDSAGEKGPCVSEVVGSTCTTSELKKIKKNANVWLCTLGYSSPE